MYGGDTKQSTCFTVPPCFVSLGYMFGVSVIQIKVAQLKFPTYSGKNINIIIVILSSGKFFIQFYFIKNNYQATSKKD